MISPNGRTVYVLGSNPGTVTPISTRTLRPGKPIKVGGDPGRMAITPDGRTLYVTMQASNTVIPISTAISKPGKPIRVWRRPVRRSAAP